MKKLLLIAILAAVPATANAAMTVDEMTNPTAVKNNGYSAQMADAVSVSKARSNSEEFYTADEEAFAKQNKFVRFWRKLYVYTDPGAEDYSFYHHDIKTVPSYKDL